MSNQPALQTTQLTKQFGRHRGVEDISITVEHGEIFGFLGPNGAGKSTTIRLILGLLRPTRGSARVLGLDAWRDRVRIHSEIGVLPSDFAFEDSLTGRGLLALFDRLRGRKPDTYADELAARLQADLDRPIRELSRGNHRKIGLIQALMHRPSMLILDEPTSGLDPLMQEEFLQLIAEARNRGCTVMLSSHNMAEVERSCDRVAMVHEGRLLAIHSVEDLLSQTRRKLRITYEQMPEMRSFAELPQVRSVRETGGALEIEVEGDMDAVLRRALATRVTDISSERPSLEDVFVELYEAVGPQ